MLKKAKFKKIISLVLSIVFVLSLLTMPSSANPSSWCLMHKKTGCTHCVNHTIMGVGSATANCTDPGGGIGSCITLGCGHTFYQTAPTNVHSYTNNVCLLSVNCGRLNTNNSSHFTHYMYRRGNHARHISCGWLGYAGHRAIDVTNGSGTSISGFPIYAKGPGTVVKVAGTSTGTTGFYVVILYENGYVARYLHVQDGGRPTQWSSVTSQTKIANTSNTGSPTGDGSGSYGHHLHFDVIHINNVTDKVNFNDLGMSNTNNINPTGLFPSGTFS